MFLFAISVGVVVAPSHICFACLCFSMGFCVVALCSLLFFFPFVPFSYWNPTGFRTGPVVVPVFRLIFLILAAVFPLDAFKTLYIFDMFTKIVILA